jgi:hypothetical protein
VGVCEECDSMGVRDRTKRSAVDPSPLLPTFLRVNRASSRPFDYAPFVARFGAQRKQGKQGKQFKVERANIQRGERGGTECAESPWRSLASGLSVNRVKGTGGIGDDHEEW